jgi:hypothetical protein
MEIKAGLVMVTILVPLSASAQYSYPGPNESLPDSTTYRVKGNVEDGYLNMREGPGVRYRVMTRIPAGVGGIESKNECVRPNDRSSHHPFCLVEWHKFRGWMSSLWLEPEGEDQSAQR